MIVWSKISSSSIATIDVSQQITHHLNSFYHSSSRQYSLLIGTFDGLKWIWPNTIAVFVTSTTIWRTKIWIWIDDGTVNVFAVILLLLIILKLLSFLFITIHFITIFRIGIGHYYCQTLTLVGDMIWTLYAYESIVDWNTVLSQSTAPRR